MKVGPLPRARVAAIVAAGLLALAAQAQAQVQGPEKPAAASRGPGDVHVFARGSDGALWTAQWDGANWAPWSSLGGELIHSPGAGTHRGMLDAVIAGGNGALFHKSSGAGDPISWNRWTAVDAVLTSAPAAAGRRGGAFLDVAGRGTDQSIYFAAIDLATGKWVPWVNIGKPGGEAARGGPAVASPLHGYVHVLVRGPRDEVWVKHHNGREWVDWVSIGGATNADPVAVSTAEGTLDVFIRGTDGQVWQRSWTSTDGWFDWKPVAPAPAGGLAATAEGPGRIWLFAGQGQDLVYDVYDRRGWSGWQQLRVAGAPAPGPDRPAQLCGGSGPKVSVGRRPHRAVAFGARPRISGRVRSADGSLLGGAEVRLVEVGPGLRELARTRSGRTGRFSVRLPRGSSRTLRVGVPAGANNTLSCSGEFRVDVKAGVTLKAPRVVRGRRIAFSGRLRSGPIPQRGLVVELLAFDGGRWRQFKSTRTNRRGRFKTSYRLQRTSRPRSFRFRARVRVQPPYPYALGTSRAVRVRVRP